MKTIPTQLYIEVAQTSTTKAKSIIIYSVNKIEKKLNNLTTKTYQN